MVNRPRLRHVRNTSRRNSRRGRPGPRGCAQCRLYDTLFRFRGKIKLMSEEASELLRKALTLPVGERAELPGSLIESLDSAKDKSMHAAWDEEIVRRMEELDSGKVKPVPLDEGRRRLS